MLKVHNLIWMCWIIYIYSTTDAWYLQHEEPLWLRGFKLTPLAGRPTMTEITDVLWRFVLGAD